MKFAALGLLWVASVWFTQFILLGRTLAGEAVLLCFLLIMFGIAVDKLDGILVELRKQAKENRRGED